MKITFINEMARFCDVSGANVQTIAKALGMDGRISHKFLHPGPGYGGSCFPKDTKALAYTARKFGTPLELIETTVKSNEEQKHYAAKKILKMIGDPKDKKVGLLGLSFKPETDDMRDSSAIVIVEELLKAGVEEIKAFDPQAMENAKKIFKDKIVYCSNEYEVAKDVDVLAIVTEWNQFRNLDLQKIKSSMKGKAFCDLRNIYKPEEVKEAGLIYEGIGIK
jgi:UDPglucose 6-dehydrogenase